MKISLNWLNDFIDINEIAKRTECTGIKLAEEIADKLTGVGFEVEEIVDVAKHLRHVVVGRIEKIERHPDADKLVVCQVNIGERNVQIITSATNVFEGAVVPVSLDGADLANGVQIKTSKVRGVVSEGMFCSGEELGIDDNLYEGAEINGILIFKDNFKPGQPVATALNLDDYMLDVSITANRPDAMSIIGIAREVSAIYRIPLKPQDLSYAVVGGDVKEYISVENKDFERCPRYVATAVKNIKIQKSPLAIRARLFIVGIHAINNIVDITNYVLVEYGQPMHAFDRENIGGKKIVIRTAKKDEKISVLNGNTYELNENNLVIADEHKPMVIAGVIGGVDSCITDNTKTVIFESACFERSQLRKTARGIGVRTDSSARFEKGIDLGSQELGMKKALNLISKLHYGEIINGMIDCRQVEVKSTTVIVSKERINKILGIIVAEKDIVEILASLGIQSKVEGDKITLLVPTYRSDIETDADVAEEIIRMYGYDVYDNIDKPLLEGGAVLVGKNDATLKAQRDMKNILVNKGYLEINSYSLVPVDAHIKLNIEERADEVIRVANPLSDELGALRISLAHSLFANIAYNTKRANKDFKTFEGGRTYHAKSQPMKEQPDEKNMFAFASVCADDDFFTFKGIIENLLAPFAVKYTIDYSKSKILHPGISADFITENGTVIASIGQINPKVAKVYDIPEKTFYGEISCDMVAGFAHKTYAVKKISKFPIVERDLAIVVDEKVAVGEIETIIKQCCGSNFYSVKLFDIYRNKEQLGEKRSLAFRIRLLSDEKTLSEDDINRVIDKILRRVNQLFGATLR